MGALGVFLVDHVAKIFQVLVHGHVFDSEAVFSYSIHLQIEALFSPWSLGISICSLFPLFFGPQGSAQKIFVEPSCTGKPSGIHSPWTSGCLSGSRDIWT